MEKICCAAIKRSDGIILAGRNHAFVIKHSPFGTCKNNSLQGFLTSEARFVGRSEAGTIAYAAKQIATPTKMLLSEDITNDDPWAGEIIENLQTEIAKLKELLQDALLHIECKNASQSGLITTIGEALKG